MSPVALVFQKYFLTQLRTKCNNLDTPNVQGGGGLGEPWIVTIYAPVFYTGPCIMFWRRGYTLRGEVGGGWDLEFPSFLGPVKW
jgi:hypothetical protein